MKGGYLRPRFRQPLLVWVGGFLGFLALLFLVVWVLNPLGYKETGAPPALSHDRGVEEFFEEYWRRPIAPQGSPPPGYTEKEASLKPEACGSCHPRQYAEWRESLHSRAMGPGPWGQVIDFDRNSPAEASLCRSCHAPLSEQSPLLVKTGEGNKASYESNPHFDPELQLQE